MHQSERRAVVRKTCGCGVLRLDAALVCPARLQPLEALSSERKAVSSHRTPQAAATSPSVVMTSQAGETPGLHGLYPAHGHDLFTESKYSKAKYSIERRQIR